MRQSGLADLLPSLRAVYVGLSAGSMMMPPSIGKEFFGWTPPTGGDETLGLVDFSIFPHLDHPDLPENSMTDAERWAVGLSVPANPLPIQTKPPRLATANQPWGNRSMLFRDPDGNLINFFTPVSPDAIKKIAQ
jgi:hypothetical protein